MRWIKLFGSALADERLLNLRNDHGFLGIGVYYALLAQVECLGEGMQHIDLLRGIFNGKVSRKLVTKILTSYGLFTVNAMGIVRSRDCIPGYSVEEMQELRRTDVGDPSAGTTYACEDQIREEEIITNMRFRRPSVEEVREYCDERRNMIDAEQFVDYYESKGWRVGHNPMKDWKACVRTWERKRACRSANRDEDLSPVKASAVMLETTDSQGNRYVDGRLIPKDAPPRPSANAIWDDASGTWFELYH